MINRALSRFVDPNPKRRLLRLSVAIALFGAIFATRMLFNTGVDAIGLLWVIPIALIALDFGIIGGLIAATLTMVASGIWSITSHVDLSLTGYVTRAIAFYTIALFVGWIVSSRAQQERELQAWFDLTPDLCCILSTEGVFKRVNSTFRDLFGYEKRELIGRSYIDFIHPEDLERTSVELARLGTSLRPTIDFQTRFRTKDGSYRWIEWNGLSDPKKEIIYATARDITGRKLTENERADLFSRVEAISRTDQLTGLPNRRAWDEELIRQVARATRKQTPMCVAMVDLDRFKDYNDTNGHLSGDQLLAEAALAWQSTLRVSDYIARYGGEEFALLMPDCSVDDADLVLERVRTATPRGQTCSIGYACLEVGEAPKDVLQRADEALYGAKRAGRDRTALAV